MPHFFSSADLLLVSLKKDPIFSLTIPNKVQSYMACGKPIIASLEGEGKRIIEESFDKEFPIPYKIKSLESFFIIIEITFISKYIH